MDNRNSSIESFNHKNFEIKRDVMVLSYLLLRPLSVYGVHANKNKYFQKYYFRSKPGATNTFKNYSIISNFCF